MKKWKDLLAKFGTPIDRLEKYLTKRGLITPERTASIRQQAKNQVRDALKGATGQLFPEIDSLFEDVYEKLPNNLVEQREELRQHVRKYPEDYELEKFRNGKSFLN